MLKNNNNDMRNNENTAFLQNMYKTVLSLFDIKYKVCFVV